MHSSPESALVLATDHLVSGYSTNIVLRDVSIETEPRGITAVIGHNGAGKSTLLKALFGLLPIVSGGIAINGHSIVPSPKKMLMQGIRLVPQGGRVFIDLTVAENLEIGGTVLPNRSDGRQIELTFRLFPRLAERRRDKAGTLSGGERQMLSIAMALVSAPRAMLLDEPSLGLPLGLVRTVLEYIRQLCHEKGVAVLMVEQNVREALRISDRVIVLRNGRVSFSGDASALNDESLLRSVYL